MELITINLRGAIFMTDPTILKNISSSSPLRGLNNDSLHYIPSRDEYFFNRNPAIFHNVLDYCISGKLHIPSNLCTEDVRKELKYWGVPQGVVEKCCWKSFYQNDDDMGVLKKLLHSIPFKERTTGVEKEVHSAQNIKHVGVRKRIWMFLNDPPETSKAKVWFGFLYVMILASVITYILLSLPSFRVEKATFTEYPSKDLYNPSDTLMEYWNTTPHSTLLWTDASVNGVLLVEWVLRFATCPCIKQFFCGILNITDIIALICTGFGIWIEIGKNTLFDFQGAFEIGYIFAAFYSTRIFRIFRIVQHNVGMKILLLSLRSSAAELLILTLSFVSISFMFGVVIFFAEMTSHTASITNFMKAIWWAVITMTTVGYGDTYPTTEAGYFIGGLCAIAGILLIALPVAVTSSNFYDFYTFNKYRLCFGRDQYEERLSGSRRRSYSVKALFSRKKSCYEPTVLEEKNESETDIK